MQKGDSVLQDLLRESDIYIRKADKDVFKLNLMS